MISSDPGFIFVDMIDTGTDIKLDNLEVVMLDAKTNCAICEANATLVPVMLKHLFVETV